MRILLTNDDGINSLGIFALAKRLHTKHDVFVVAPDSQRSGASHSFTYNIPLRASKVSLNGLDDVTAFAISGSPVDCVKLAIGNLVGDVDFVISGINYGKNIGTDTFYSGTVGAAMEAVLSGIPAIAISDCEFSPKYFDTSAYYAEYAIELMQKIGRTMLLNVNAPDLPLEDIKGIKFTKLSKQVYEGVYEQRTDPSGRPYYWTPSGRIIQHTAEEDNDERWTNDGYVSITPLLTDLTDFNELDILGKLNND